MLNKIDDIVTWLSLSKKHLTIKFEQHTIFIKLALENIMNDHLVLHFLEICLHQFGHIMCK